MTTLKEFQASAADMGETLHTTTVAWVLHQSKLHGREPLEKSFTFGLIRPQNLHPLDHGVSHMHFGEL